MRITIGGMPGSGKSTVAKLVAKELDLRFYSMGKIMRELASKREMAVNEYTALKEDVDSELDNYQKELGEKEDNFIIEGRLSFHFIPKSIKFFFDVDLETAAKRIFKNQRASEKHYSSVKETLDILKLRIAGDRQRYAARYGIDAFNYKNFDSVIDTSDLTVEQVKDKVIAFIKRNKDLFKF